MIEHAKLEFTFLKLGMAHDFIDRAAKLGLSNLNDLLSVNLGYLKSHQEFNYSWYAEMLALLKGQGLLHEFQRRALGGSL